MLRSGEDCTRAVFHDLRRSYGSLLLNAGANAEVIQELLGHADMRTTRRVYAHLLNVTIANTVKSKLPSFGHERSNVRKLAGVTGYRRSQRPSG